MVRRVLIGLLGAVLFSAMIVGTASAATTVNRFPIDDPLFETSCLREPLHITGEEQIIVTSQENASGGTTFQTRTIFSGVKGVGLRSGQTYNLVFSSGSTTNETVTAGTEVTRTSRFQVIGTGQPDPGLTATASIVNHFTVNANGEVTTDFAFRNECD